MEHRVQYAGNLGKVLDHFIRANGDYLFMGFTVLCFFAILWLLCHKRKPLPPLPVDARTRAIIGIMLVSPGMSSDADGGRTRLIMGDPPARSCHVSDWDRR